MNCNHSFNFLVFTANLNPIPPFKLDLDPRTYKDHRSSGVNEITKEGWLYKGPDKGSENSFSFSRVYS